MIWDGTQRRRFARGSIPFKMYIYAPQGHILSTYTQDISRAGVRVIVDEKLEVNSTVMIEIYLQEDSSMFEGRIVWVKERENPHDKDTFLFETGIELTKELPEKLK